MANIYLKKSFNIIKKIIIILLYLILIPILIVNLIFIIKYALQPDKIPDFFGTKAFIVVTGSMEPEINIGDLVLTNEIRSKRIKRARYYFF